MKIRVLLADTGRMAGEAANLLNVGWAATTAVPLPPDIGGWGLPQQAVAVFVETDGAEQQVNLTLELRRNDGEPAYYTPGPQKGNPGVPVRVSHSVTTQAVAAAPDSAPSRATFIADFSAGSLWVAEPRHWYTWHVTVAGESDEVGFWVDEPANLKPAADPATDQERLGQFSK